MANNYNSMRNTYLANTQRQQATNSSSLLKNSALNKLPMTTSQKLTNETTTKRKKSKSNWWKRTQATGMDLYKNVATGLFSPVENIVDLGALGVQKGVGLISNNAAEDIKKFRYKNYTENISNFAAGINMYGNQLVNGNYKFNPFSSDDVEDVIKESYIYDASTNAQNIIRGTAQGVGQVLNMMVTAGIAGGIAKANGVGEAAQFSNIAKGMTTATQATEYANKAGQMAALISMGVSAGGGAELEAEMNGASLPDALAYGMASGIVEFGTEAISGAIGSKLGGGITAIPGVGTKVATTTGGKIAQLAGQGLSEGLEEAVSDLANPFIKHGTIDRNSNLKDEYTSKEFWNGVKDDFIVGALSGIIAEAPSVVLDIRTDVKSKQTIKNATNELENRGLLTHEEAKNLRDNLNTYRQIAKEYQVATTETQKQALDVKLNDVVNNSTPIIETIKENIAVEEENVAPNTTENIEKVDTNTENNAKIDTNNVENTNINNNIDTTINENIDTNKQTNKVFNENDIVNSINKNGIDNVNLKSSEAKTTSNVEYNQLLEERLRKLIKAYRKANPNLDNTILNENINKIKNKYREDNGMLKATRDRTETPKNTYKKVTNKRDNSGAIDPNKVVVNESKNQLRLRDEIRNSPDFSKDFIDAVENNKLPYVVHSDAEAKNAADKVANKPIKEQIDTAKSIIDFVQRNGLISKNDVVIGYSLIMKLAATNDINNVRLAQNLMNAISMGLTGAGQAVQAAKLIKLLTPQGKLDYYNTLLNKEIKRREKYFKDNDSVKGLPENVIKDRKAKHFANDLEFTKKSEIAKVNDNYFVIDKDTQTKMENIPFNENTTLDSYVDLCKSNNIDVDKYKGAIEKYVEFMTDSYNKLKTLYDSNDLLLPAYIADKISKANTEQEVNAANKEALGVLELQHELTFLEKCEQFRIFAMLFNAKTHGRNFIGNAVMKFVSDLNDKVASVYMKAYEKKNGVVANKQFSFKNASKDVKAYAKSTFSEDYFKTETKYDLQNSNRKTFNSRFLAPLNSAIQFNSWALEKEDAIFLKSNFQHAFAEWMTANDYSIDYVETNPDVKQNGIDISVQTALENTFHEANNFADMINRLKNQNTITKVFGNALMPFTKTPLNIVRQAVRYSPIGLLNASISGTKQLHNGNINVNQWCNMMAKGTTGTLTIVLGALLAKLGLISIGDDDEYEYNTTRNRRNYTINIGGLSYTMDWLSPSAIPIFTGCAIQESFNGNNGDDFLTSLYKGTLDFLDPITEMSMLSSLNNAIKTYNQDNALSDIVVTLSKDYTSAFIPTLVSQFAKIVDPYNRSTKSTKSGFTGNLQKITNTWISKLPFISYQLEPYVDSWGNKSKKYNNFADGTSYILNNSISPGYISLEKSTSVDKEIDFLTSQTGNSISIPNTPNYYYTVNGKRYNMSPTEYTDFKVEVGKNSHQALSLIINQNYYKNLSVEDKELIFKKVYEFARDYSKGTGKFSNPDVIRYFDFDEFMNYYLYCSTITKDTYNSKKQNVSNYLNSTNLSKIQKDVLLEALF